MCSVVGRRGIVSARVTLIRIGESYSDCIGFVENTPAVVLLEAIPPRCLSAELLDGGVNETGGTRLGTRLSVLASRYNWVSNLSQYSASSPGLSHRLDSGSLLFRWLLLFRCCESGRN